MRTREQLNDKIGKVNRSKITNNTRLFQKNVDGRTVDARRWKDIHDQLADHLGGLDKLNPKQLLLLRNCAGAQLSCEQMESKMLEGAEDYDVLAHGRMIGTLNRTLDLLDPEVRNKNVTGPNDFPGSLEDYLASPECRETAIKNRQRNRSHK